MLPLGSLTPTAIGYYTAVATVIPVLLVAAVVQLAAFGRQAFARLALLFVADVLGGLFMDTSNPRTRRRLKVISNVSFALIIVLLGGLLALVILPAAGETAAFVALSRDSSSSLERLLVVSGLAASGLAVMVSMAVTIVSAMAKWTDDLKSSATPTAEE